MMKRAILAFLVMIPMCLAAQSAKFGKVDFDAIFAAMPQKVAAEAQLQQSSDAYQTEYKMLQDEFNRKYADYQTIANDPATPQTIKERRMQEIQENNKKIENFMNSVSDDMAKKEKELIEPIKERINAAIDAVGTAGGYTAIFRTGDVLWVGSSVDDLTAKVRTALGLPVVTE